MGCRTSLRKAEGLLREASPDIMEAATKLDEYLASGQATQTAGEEDLDAEIAELAKVLAQDDVMGDPDDIDDDEEPDDKHKATAKRLLGSLASRGKKGGFLSQGRIGVAGKIGPKGKPGGQAQTPAGGAGGAAPAGPVGAGAAGASG